MVRFTCPTLLGDSGDFCKHLSGRQGVLAWRYLLLAPVDFKKSLALKNGGSEVGERLAWFYLKKQPSRPTQIRAPRRSRLRPAPC